MRTWVYIDGFNLYYAIRESGCKLLNRSARRSGDAGRDRDHQQGEVPHGARFRCGKGNKVQPPATDALKAQVHLMEEAGSDVNLACYLIHEGWAGRYDGAVVISNDTDLVESIRIVVQEPKKPVALLCLGRSAHRSCRQRWLRPCDISTRRTLRYQWWRSAASPNPPQIPPQRPSCPWREAMRSA